MILDITKSTLRDIRNPVTREYANTYVHIYQDFMDQIRAMGIEFEEKDESVSLTQRIADIRKKGVQVRNGNKSLFLNDISPGCVACQTGVGSLTFFVSLKCHRDCFYCFNPNQENYSYFLEHKRDLIRELDDLKKTTSNMRHIALTGGEPLLYKDETIRFFEHANKLFPETHTRLYTSGDHIDREILESLQEAGLKEIRFSIRMHDLAKGQRHTYDRIALARDYIPRVMVEMPVLPDTLEEMKGVLRELDQLDIFGINLLEFCFPLNNVDAFRERGFKIKARPFHVLYDYWYAGGLPIAGSEAVCLDLIDFAGSSGLKLGVHYCSVENKQTGQIYHQNNRHNLPRHVYFSQRDYFLKTAKVFGEDIPVVMKVFEKSGYNDFAFSEEHNSLEFHISQINNLKELDIDVGVTSQVVEIREKELFLRELKLDITSPKVFRLSKDV